MAAAAAVVLVSSFPLEFNSYFQLSGKPHGVMFGNLGRRRRRDVQHGTQPSLTGFRVLVDDDDLRT